MLRTKLIEQSFDDLFKRQPLDESQKENVKISLENSRYSRLNYRKSSEFFTDALNKIQDQLTASLVDIKPKPIEEETSHQNSTELLNDKILPNIELTKQDEKEIERLIDSFQKTTSKNATPLLIETKPVSLYSTLPDLSQNDDNYIEQQDKNRMKKFQDASKKIAKKITEKQTDNLLSSLETLKEHQNTLKEQNLGYIIPKESPHERRMKLELEQKRCENEISNIEGSLKSLKVKFKASGIASQLGTLPAYAELNQVLDSMELLTKKELREMEMTNLTDLVQMYVHRQKNITHQLNTHLDNYERACQAEKSEAERKLKEKEARAKREDQFLKTFPSNVEKYKLIREKSNELAGRLNHNTEAIRMLTSSASQQSLIDQLTHLKQSLDQTHKSIDADVAKYEKYCSRLVIEKLSDSEIYDVDQMLSDRILKAKHEYEKLSEKVESIEERCVAEMELVKREKEKHQQLELQKADEQRRRIEAHEAEKQQRQRAEEAEKQQRQQAEEAEKQQRQRADETKRAEREKRNDLLKNVDENNKNGITKATQANYEKLQTQMCKLRKESEDALNAVQFKMYKFDLQKAVNFPLNSLLDDSEKSIEENKRNFTEKIKTLCKLFSGQTCTITSTLTVNATKNPRAIDYCLLYLAKKVIEKAEDTVAARPETAFHYAYLIIEVMRQVNAFDEILIAHFHEKCPYTIPYYKAKAADQTKEQYSESLGYKIINGKVEEDVHFYKRMSGMLYLYFTLLITTQGSNIFNMKTAWNWLTDVLNMIPRANITPEMLTIYFRCCGLRMQQTYGRQFHKCVDLCMNDFLNLIKSIPAEKQSGASVGRFEAILDEFKKNRQFPVWKRV